jgi:hypothetical protein
MIRARSVWSLAVALLCLAPAARGDGRNGLDVELWTNKGQDAVYQPGDPLEVKARVSDDAYLLVYEIDAEGNVRLIAPEWGARGFVPGGETFQVPSPHSDMELVVAGPTGQGFLVAIASRDPFRPLPWYLRPYNAQAEDIGYQGRPDEDEEGVTEDGRIVGDPFVAMERIRRRVLADPEDEESFATAYTSYYVHHAVRYPRYICYDCHRPNQWAWWDGFDPYYASCSVIDFRINWGWGWGPAYWYGYVPYYYYVVRADCPPRYRLYSAHDACFSSWDGRRRWNTLWGNMQRRPTAPPPGYVPPSKYDGRTVGLRQPPGFLAGGRTLSDRRAAWVPSTRENHSGDRASRGDRSGAGDPSRGDRAGGLQWRDRTGDAGRSAGRDGRASIGSGRQDASSQGRDRAEARERGFGRELPRPNRPWEGRERPAGDPAGDRRRSGRPAPGYERPRDLPRPSYDPARERPRPSFEVPRERPRSQVPSGRPEWTRERSQPRYEAPRPEPARERPQRSEPPQRAERDRGQEGGRDRDDGDGGRGHGRGR